MWQNIISRLFRKFFLYHILFTIYMSKIELNATWKLSMFWCKQEKRRRLTESCNFVEGFFSVYTTFKRLVKLIYLFNFFFLFIGWIIAEIVIWHHKILFSFLFPEKLKNSAHFPSNVSIFMEIKYLSRINRRKKCSLLLFQSIFKSLF